MAPTPEIPVTEEMARAGAEILSSYYDTRCDDVTQELAADVFREMTGVRDRDLTPLPALTSEMKDPTDMPQKFPRILSRDLPLMVQFAEGEPWYNLIQTRSINSTTDGGGTILWFDHDSSVLVDIPFDDLPRALEAAVENIT